MKDRVHLQAPSGVVIGFTLPLHEAIEGQWNRGELQRVTEDGKAWDGDQYDVSGVRGAEETPAADAAPAEPDDDPEPARPADSAPKQAWQSYAVAVGAVGEEEAAGMTRAELIDSCTPPEMRPAVPET